MAINKILKLNYILLKLYLIIWEINLEVLMAVFSLELTNRFISQEK
jgi:hypothetical protein